jgi:hypothetical protein
MQGEVSWPCMTRCTHGCLHVMLVLRLLSIDRRQKRAACCRGWSHQRAGVASTATGDCKARQPLLAPQLRRAMPRATKPHRCVMLTSFCLHAARALNAIRGPELSLLEVAAGRPKQLPYRNHHEWLMFRGTLASSRWMLFHHLEGARHQGQRAATGCGTPRRCPHLGKLLLPSTNSLWARRPPKR